ncbi:hypothetical protein RF11_09559 [Thelohanellus kitauei]|uniref:Uncharacterized protein n=1 Tax=Thelohanellus kitauei TaxID=669202 RepID=A0A0C2ITF9_THEKT|nr:hypothetical protein RF11_09559 [Thelohanellus kitauei]
MTRNLQRSDDEELMSVSPKILAMKVKYQSSTSSKNTVHPNRRQVERSMDTDKRCLQKHEVLGSNINSNNHGIISNSKLTKEGADKLLEWDRNNHLQYMEARRLTWDNANSLNLVPQVTGTMWTITKALGVLILGALTDQESINQLLFNGVNKAEKLSDIGWWLRHCLSQFDRSVMGRGPLEGWKKVEELEEKHFSDLEFENGYLMDTG